MSSGIPVTDEIDGNLNVRDFSGTGKYGNVLIEHDLTVQGTIHGSVAGSGLAPSGDTTGAKDTASITALLALTGAADLAAGTWYLSTNLALPPGSRLSGPIWEPNDVAGSAAARIRAGSGFAQNGALPAALVCCVDQATGGYATASNSQEISRLILDGTGAPAALDGFNVTGHVTGPHLQGVTINNFTGSGVSTATNASGIPNGLRYLDGRLAGNDQHGLDLSHGTDMVMTRVQAISSGSAGTFHAWNLGSASNSAFSQCKGEHSTGEGFHLAVTATGQGSGTLIFTGCSTDGNTRNGFTVTGAGTVTILVSGCSFRRDGANGGSGGGGFAGVSVTSYSGAVIFAGLGVWPGIPDGGVGTNAPETGMIVTGSNIVTVASGWVQGQTTAITDGGGNTVFTRGPNVTTATGATSAPVVTPPLLRVFDDLGQALITGATGTSPLLELANSTGSAASAAARATLADTVSVAFAARVTGDTSSRYRVGGDGQARWGPGNATQDVALRRGAAGRLDLSTSGITGFVPLAPGGMGALFLAPTGANGQTFGKDLAASATNAPAVSGTVYLSACFLPAGITVANITMVTGTGTLKTGGTHGWYCLADSGLVVRAATGDQTDAATVWGTASTAYTLATNAYVTTYTGLYYIGIMVANSGGSQPNMVAHAALAAGVSGIAPKTAGPSTASLTTPPATDGSVTLAGITASATQYFYAWTS